ncbi:MAG: N-acetyl-gamma-glutamyl-phosphate reductase [Planctomycetes bacterium]|nr:N-acetyl-gamma-glutamyl-phosphate reductase [Planctomycetota bacterium]
MADSPIRIALFGASGYVGGELLRLLADHPHFEVVFATSESNAKRPITRLHPHLRGLSKMRFCKMADVQEVDLIISALPHGMLVKRLTDVEKLAPRIMDCSADFRLHQADHYQSWYGDAHPMPDQLGNWVYGLAEMHREELRGADRVSGVGCNATAVNLALLPIARAGLLKAETRVIAEVKAGSSEAGRTAKAAGMHAERSGVVRSFAPTGHRHTAEIEQQHRLNDVHISITSVDRVRGAMATCQLFLEELPSELELWEIYRSATREEPFLRIVHENSGAFRHPDPKLLDGSNFADLGWSRDERSGRLVTLAAIDNLGKGAAGSALQCLNLMYGLPEELGLAFTALFPA